MSNAEMTRATHAGPQGGRYLVLGMCVKGQRGNLLRGNTIIVGLGGCQGRSACGCDVDQFGLDALSLATLVPCTWCGDLDTGCVVFDSEVPRSG